MTDTPHDSPDRWTAEAAAAADARGRLRARFAMVLCAFVLVWVLAEGLTIWDQLPDRIPTHFNLRGEPDAWGPKTIFTVFGPPIAAALLLLLFVPFISVRFNPRYINVPRKEFFLALPPALQDHVIAPIREGMAWLAASIAIGLSLLCRQSWDVALERRAAMSPFLMPIAIVIGTAAAIVGIVHVYRRIRDLEKAA